MNTTLKQINDLSLLIKVLVIFLSMILVGLGMALMTIGDLGSDAITTLINGVANILKLSNGQGTTLVMIIFLVFGLFLIENSLELQLYFLSD